MKKNIYFFYQIALKFVNRQTRKVTMKIIVVLIVIFKTNFNIKTSF